MKLSIEADQADLRARSEERAAGHAQARAAGVLKNANFGLSIFAVAAVTGIHVGEIIRGGLPFICILFICLAVLSMVPAISTFLPNLFFG